MENAESNQLMSLWITLLVHCALIRCKWFVILERQLLKIHHLLMLRVRNETKYMLLSRHQNAGQNHDKKTGNRCSENVAQFRYLGTTITN
jgi:hypothetical protein